MTTYTDVRGEMMGWLQTGVEVYVRFDYGSGPLDFDSYWLAKSGTNERREKNYRFFIRPGTRGEVLSVERSEPEEDGTVKILRSEIQFDGFEKVCVLNGFVSTLVRPVQGPHVTDK
jgi:hypothetical protein